MPYALRPKVDLVCPQCSGVFLGNGNSVCCSPRCRTRARDERRKLACANCGGPVWYSRTTRPQGEAWCRECQRAQHGTRRTYRAGCRCDPCKERAAADQRRYAEAFRERTGQSIYKKFRKADGTYRWISAADREVVYERDGWVCQLCFDPVDRLLAPNDRWAATLDHIECRSWSLVPDDRPENLRLAHRSCNSARRDRVA